MNMPTIDMGNNTDKVMYWFWLGFGSFVLTSMVFWFGFAVFAGGCFYWQFMRYQFLTKKNE
jgi:hypothetical protein